MRLKIKFEDYVRLHKIVTGLSKIGLWEMLAAGKDLRAIIVDIPDEMHEWVKQVVGELISAFNNIERIAIKTRAEVRGLATRKEQAEVVKRSPYPGVVFSMLDDKDYKSIIWKMLRPHGANTFRKDIDL